MKKEQIRGFREVARKMLVWASDEVVRAWVQVRMNSPSEGSMAVVWKIEDLLHAIRKDLGHRSRLPRGELLKVFLNDLEDYLQKQRESPDSVPTRDE